MSEIKKNLAHFEAFRIPVEVLLQNPNFSKKFGNKEEYVAHEQKWIKNYKTNILTHIANSEWKNFPLDIAVRKTAEDIQATDIAKNDAILKSNSKFHDHCAWLWKGALEVLEKSVAHENKQVLEESQTLD